MKRIKRESVSVAGARVERFFESPFSGLEKLFPERVGLSRFDGCEAFSRALLGATSGQAHFGEGPTKREGLFAISPSPKADEARTEALLRKVAFGRNRFAN